MKTIELYPCEIVDKNHKTQKAKSIYLPETPQIGAFIHQSDAQLKNKVIYEVIGIRYTGGKHSGYIELILKILF